MELSIILPVYNEKENLEILFSELKSVLDEMDNTAEMVFIDDRSTDGHPAVAALRLRMDGHRPAWG